MRFSISIVTLAILSISSVLAELGNSASDQGSSKVADAVNLSVVKGALDKVIPGAKSEESYSNNGPKAATAGQQAVPAQEQTKEQPETQERPEV